jgi:tRNA(His) 5'-end guanylyltransferase
MTRIKSNYEDRSRFKLSRRTPVIIRVDGKSFHTLTRSMMRPFDFRLVSCMTRTAQELCIEIQGCKLAYIQSDEISLLLTDFDKLDTQAWFDYNIQKMCSISAAIATHAFNDVFKFYFKGTESETKFGLFDSRCFNIPEAEVNNYFLARQRDAVKNSITMVAQKHFSHEELDGVSSNEKQNKLLVEKNISWSSFPCQVRQGRCIIKTENGWEVDDNIPLFNEKPEYIEKYLVPGVE